jgi:hypothetical protein
LFQSENALYNAKVKMLEGKLEKQQELNAQMHLLSEELRKVKEENGALEKKLEETGLKAEMAKNEVKNMARNLV